MAKTSTNLLSALQEPNALRGIDTLVERVSRFFDEKIARPKLRRHPAEKVPPQRKTA